MSQRHFSRTLLVLILIALVGVTGGCAKRHYRKGNAALDRGNMQAAIEQYKIAVKKAPENVLFLCALGDAYLRDSDYGKAVRVLTKAVEVAPDHADALDKLAFAHSKNGSPNGAIEVYWHLFSIPKEMSAAYGKLVPLLEDEQRFGEVAEATLLLSQQPGFDPSLLTTQAEKCLRLNFVAEAEKLYARAVELNPNQAALWHTLGDLQLKSGNAKSAATSFSNAYKLDPSDIRAAIGSAEALEKTGQVKEAMALYESALAQDPELKAPRLALIEIYIKMNRLDEAASFAREALIRYPDDPNVKALKGAVHLAKGEWDKAIAILNLAVTRSETENPKVLRMLGQAYLNLGERARARRYFARALSHDPEDGYAYLGLCQLDLEDDREEQGIERCQKAILHVPALRDDAVSLMTAYYEKGERYLKAAEIEEEAPPPEPAQTTVTSVKRTVKKSESRAETQGRLDRLKDLKEILEAVPPEDRSAREWFELGETCLKLEDLDGAVKALTQAWKKDPDNLEYRIKMAEVLLADNKYDSAILHFKEIVRLDDENVKARFALVQAYLGRGAADDAYEVLKELRELDPENPKAYELSAEAAFELGLTPEGEAFQRQASEKRAAGPR